MTFDELPFYFDTTVFFKWLPNEVLYINIQLHLLTSLLEWVYLHLLNPSSSLNPHTIAQKPPASFVSVWCGKWTTWIIEKPPSAGSHSINIWRCVYRVFHSSVQYVLKISGYNYKMMSKKQVCINILAHLSEVVLIQIDVVINMSLGAWFSLGQINIGYHNHLVKN